MSSATAILLPAVFAGLVAIAVSRAIEAFGGRIGGFLGTLPTTIVPSAIGMYANDPTVFTAALAVAPAGMLVNVLFLWAWRVIPPRLPELPLGAALGVMVVLTLGFWGAGASVVLALTHRAAAAGLPPLAIGIVATVLIVVTGIIACWEGVPAPRGVARVPVGVLALRGLLAGAAIGVALLIARSGQGSLAGLASVFPAIFLTSMVSVWWSQGRAVSGGAVGPMMLGSASVAVYALAAAVLFPLWGWAWGTLSAWVLAVGTTTLPANLWLRRRG